MFSASLRTGTTMETANAAWSEEGKSALSVGLGLERLAWTLKPEPVPSGASRRPLLWGERASGNPFEPSGRGSNQCHNGAVLVDRKPEPAGRKPVAHEHRADGSDQRARDHVAGMMGQQHQAGC